MAEQGTGIIDRLGARRRASPAASDRQWLVGLLMVLPPVGLVFFLVGFPIVVGIVYSLGHTGGFNSAISELAQHQVSVSSGPGTLVLYQQVVLDHQFLVDLAATLWVTALSVVLVLAIAWGVALYVRFSDSLLARAISALSVVPLFIPVVIASYAILAFWSGTGFVRSAADHLAVTNFPTLGYTLAGVVIGQVWVNLPFGVLMIVSGLQRIPDVLIDASRDVGASLARTVRSVLVPMNALPTIIAATFTAIGVMGSFTVPFLIGPAAPTMLGPLATNTFQSYNEPQQAEVIAMVLFILAVGVGAAYVWANARGR